MPRRKISQREARLWKARALLAENILAGRGDQVMYIGELTVSDAIAGALRACSAFRAPVIVQTDGSKLHLRAYQVAR